MPSQIKVDEIKNVAGQYKIKTDTFEGQTTANNMTINSGNITLKGEGTATTNLQQGLAKIWFALNCTGTPANRGSFNASSVTDGGNGDMTENFTSSMNDKNYATAGLTGGISGAWADSIAHYYVADPCQTGSIRLAISYNTGLTDGERVSAQVSGDLA